MHVADRVDDGVAHVHDEALAWRGPGTSRTLEQTHGLRLGYLHWFAPRYHAGCKQFHTGAPKPAPSCTAVGVRVQSGSAFHRIPSGAGKTHFGMGRDAAGGAR